jgi:pimeloyl-ACP methyl ester carboxylesterase
MADPAQGVEIVTIGEGDGVPILLLHEGLGSVAAWRDFPAKLAAATERKVIAVSRTGYGQSPPFEGSYEVDFMHREADATAELLRSLGVAHGHIFGHSDGASIAILLAARHPTLVASLILEAPHIFVEQICIDAIRALVRDAEATGIVARLSKYHCDAAAVFRQWTSIWLDPRFAGWTIEQEARSIDVPTLLIQGDDDAYGTYAQLDRIAAATAFHQLRLPDCGHSPHRDQPSIVMDAVTAFLGEVA